MNTLDDLRAALEREAAFADVEAHARPLAVHQRIRAVRRRRVSTAVVAAVLVVLAAVAGGTLLRGGSTVEPAKRVDLPDQVSMSGFPYVLARVVHPANGESVPSTNRSRAAVLAASGLGDGRVTLLAGDLPVARLVADGTSAPVPVAFLGDTLRVEIDGAPDAEVQLAFYNPTDTLADGVSNGTAVFRDQLGSLTRVGAQFAKPGARGLSLTVSGSLDDLVLATWCSPGAKDTQIEVSIDGDLPSGGNCGQSDDRDAGGSYLWGFGDDGDPGVREHTVHVFLTEPDGIDPVSVPGIAFGVGAYRPTDGPTVLGMHVPGTIEWQGRTWTLDDTVTGTSADIDTGDEERLMRILAHGDGVTATYTGRLGDPARTVAVTDHDELVALSGSLLLPGDTYHVEVTAPAAIAIYRPQ